MIERYYRQAEAAFMLRIRLGPRFVWETLLEDLRKGKTRRVPPLRHIERSGRPAYHEADLLEFIEQYRRMYPDAKAGVVPVSQDIDLDELALLPD